MEEQIYTVVMSDGMYRTIKAPNVTTAFICNLAYLLRCKSQVDVVHIINEKEKIIYENIEWALIYSDRLIEIEDGSPALWTEKEVNELLRNYANFYGLSEDSATNYFKKQTSVKSSIT